MTTKRPYRQNRTARAPEARLSQAELEALKAVLDKDGVSYAEWLRRKIEEDSNVHLQGSRHQR